MTLSIIIPCYNCASTLREAVWSCYRQNLSLTEFEIIMVDDGSKDGTWELIQQLSQEHTNVRTLRHETNQGGGAARNTGIQAASGNIVYCLDSDNLFTDNSVAPMLEYQKLKQVDGVIFHHRRFFIDKNIHHYTTHTNTVLDRSITLEDLFDTSVTLLDNFFFTKEAYLKTVGYPTHHGFDTQCFEMRFLSVGNTAIVCPESTFLHRQNTDEPSYFTRVHNAGFFSINFLLIFEDIMHLFTPAVREALIRYPIFEKTRSSSDNVLTWVKNEQQAQEIFAPNYHTYLHENGRMAWLCDNKEARDHDLIACYAYVAKDKHQEAVQALHCHVQTTQFITPYFHFLHMRLLESIGGTPHKESVVSTLNSLSHMCVTPVHSRFGGVLRFIKKHPFLYRPLSLFRKK